MPRSHQSCQQLYLHVGFKIPQRWLRSLRPSGLNVMSFGKNPWRFEGNQQEMRSAGRLILMEMCPSENWVLFQTTQRQDPEYRTLPKCSCDYLWTASTLLQWRLPRFCSRQDSSVGIVTARVRFAVEARDSSRPHDAQTGSMAQPASCPLVTTGLFSER
jgi:hypothetical protein